MHGALATLQAPGMFPCKELQLGCTHPSLLLMKEILGQLFGKAGRHEDFGNEKERNPIRDRRRVWCEFQEGLAGSRSFSKAAGWRGRGPSRVGETV